MKTVAVSVLGAAAVTAGFLILRLRPLLVADPRRVALDRPLPEAIPLERLRELGM